MAKLRAAVVGGGVGGMLSMQALQRSEMYDLVAMADLREDVRNKWKAEFPQIETFGSHTEMFAALPLDVVCVSTYPPSHEEVTMEALKLPLKGILVEKPLGHTAESGEAILKAIKAKNIPVVVPHGLLAQKTPVSVLGHVRKGSIGNLKLVEILSNEWDIINAGIHWIHYFIQLTDLEPLDYVMSICENSTRTYRDGMQVETTGVTYVATKSGTRLILNTGDAININHEGAQFLFRIYGDLGTLEFYGWNGGYRILNADHPKGHYYEPEEYPAKGHQKYLEQLAGMIESGQYDSRIADSSLMALQVVEGAYYSSQHQCKVSFPMRAEDASQPDWIMGIPYSGVGGGRDGRKL